MWIRKVVFHFGFVIVILRSDTYELQKQKSKEKMEVYI